ncbi:hypothetical protein [Gordoniibacillus kamchatkensis]|uniref:hypothetical protein n=1 Tax=Gordoniibacillus kamchatkensis TaxID=1590651 RepID=UPI0012DFF954|nr:hypothetical protein [Paenibacillus sp. VKM B-2647]
MEQTNNLTEYEFEYEFLLSEAHQNWLEEARNMQPLQQDDGKFSRAFSMDKDEYEHIVSLAQQNEFIDFEIPRNAPEGRRMSESALGISPSEADFEPVNLEEEFSDN